MSGMGYGTLYVNGINVDPSRRLDPGWTTYTQRVLYVSYDITQFLKGHSTNCIGVQLGLGFYTNEQWGGGVPAPAPEVFGPPPRLLLQVNIILSDYTTMNITSDTTWLGREGAHRKDNVYMGTIYDTRAERYNWSTAGFTDPYSLWLNASLIESPLTSPTGQLTYQSMDPIRISPYALLIATSASRTGYKSMPPGVIGDVQHEDGSIPDTAPYSVGGYVADPSWAHAYPEITWRIYQHYNDTAIVKQHYAGIQAWVDYLTSRAQQSGLANMYFAYGDWETPANYPVTNSSLVSAFSYLSDVQIMIILSKILNNQTNVAKYSKLIMAGMMGTTAFLSMWMNNTASTSIMLPVVLAIVHELDVFSENSLDSQQDNIQTTVNTNGAFDSTNTEGPDENKTGQIAHTTQNIELVKPETSVVVNTRLKLLCCKRQKVEHSNTYKKQHDELKKGFLLAIAYSSSIGGLSSLVGTAPNIYLKGFVDSEYNGTGFRVNFLNFLLFALPTGILMLVVCWIWLQLCYNKKELFQCHYSAERHKAQIKLKAILTKQYKDLGRPKWSELVVAGIFVLLIVLWITREFSSRTGWSMIFQRKHISDGTVAIFCGILPLILPASNPFNRRHDWKYEPIVKWNDLAHHVSWGALILLGAGLALASAFQKSKLSDSVAQALGFVSHIPRAAAIMIIVVISGFFTEVTSNTSTATIFFPVLNSVKQTSMLAKVPFV
ncbi:unnamed protein product [Rotaria sordida]|uniref:Bacterial alpha-L-rhamnosidase N-terminal domain-containing protein n=1 Tax=Rotaria sordida TaxID=392033 RepID=A0A814M5P3_9BILA|nr:unnamed protein product [Rotaria sordida]